MKARLCERCGHGFWSQSRRHRFCSDRCRAAADRIKADAALRTAPARQSDARALYILAEWDKGRSLTQIALELGVSRQRISQVVGGLAGKARSVVPVRYAEWSARRRRTHRKLTERWKREHPELAKATGRRARLVYRLVAEGTPRAQARAIARERHPDPLPEAVAG